MAPAERPGMDLRDYLAVLVARKGVIAAGTLLVMASALVISLLQTPVYEGRTRMLVAPRESLLEQSGNVSFYNPALVETEVQVLRSEPVRALVRERINGPLPKVTAALVGQTSVAEVVAEDTNAQRAAEVANTYVQTFIEYRRDEAVAALTAAGDEYRTKIDALKKEIDELGERLRAIPPCTGNPPPVECRQGESLQQDRDARVSQLIPLEQRLQQLELDASYNRGGPQLITPAAVSDKPVRPRPIRNTLVGAGVGLIFGIALACLLEHFDDSIKSKEDLERLARDLPVLGLIPTVTMWKNRAQTRIVSQSDPTSSAAEAYRSLRTSIRFIGLDRSMRTIQVTSPNASEGKTTTVANLAVALARAGERVVIVSCDLRRPRIHEFFDLPNDIGFMSVVLGEMPLSAALQNVPGEARLQLLATGPIPANPSELLSSNRSAQVLAALRKEFSVVLIDCPPVLPVTDAAVLSAKVDGTLLVATVGTTTGKHVSRSLELLRQVGAPLIGMVLNGVGAQGSYGYHTYYGQATSTSAPNGATPKRSTADEGLFKEA